MLFEKKIKKGDVFMDHSVEYRSVHLILSTQYAA